MRAWEVARQDGLPLIRAKALVLQGCIMQWQPACQAEESCKTSGWSAGHDACASIKSILGGEWA